MKKEMTYLLGFLVAGEGAQAVSPHCTSSLKSSLVFALANDQECAQEVMKLLDSAESSPLKSQWMAYDEENRLKIHNVFKSVSMGFRLQRERRQDALDLMDQPLPAPKKEEPTVEAAAPSPEPSLSVQERWFQEKQDEACFSSMTGTFAVIAATEEGDKPAPEAIFCAKKVKRFLSDSSRSLSQGSPLAAFRRKYNQYRTWTYAPTAENPQTLQEIVGPILDEVAEGRRIPPRQRRDLVESLYALKHGYLGTPAHQGPVYEAAEGVQENQKEEEPVRAKRRLSLKESLQAAKERRLESKVEGKKPLSFEESLRAVKLRHREVPSKVEVPSEEKGLSAPLVAARKALRPVTEEMKLKPSRFNAHENPFAKLLQEQREKMGKKALEE